MLLWSNEECPLFPSIQQRRRLSAFNSSEPHLLVIVRNVLIGDCLFRVLQQFVQGQQRFAITKQLAVESQPPLMKNTPTKSHLKTTTHYRHQTSARVMCSG